MGSSGKRRVHGQLISATFTLHTISMKIFLLLGLFSGTVHMHTSSLWPMSSVPLSSVPLSSVPMSSVPMSSVLMSSVPVSSVPIHYPAPSSGYSRVECKLPTYEESCRCHNCKPEFGNPGSENKCQNCVCKGAHHILRTCDCMGGCGPARDHTGLGHIECKNCLCLE